MSSLTYYNYPGVGENNARDFYYSQAVRVGDRIELSGQGGWDPETSAISSDVKAQIDQAFKNVDLALRTAGGKGWDQVFSVKSYHIPLDDETFEVMVENFRKWMPNHKPIWTCIGVPKLGIEGMRVELEIAAYDPK